MTAALAPILPPERSVYLPQPARVVHVRSLTAMEKLVELAFLDGHGLRHQPGQFVQVSLLGVGECPISICSSPTRGPAFSLCIRRVGGVTQRLHQLECEDVIGIRGPLGHGIDVAEFAGQDVLIVAGGLGLAPVRSLIEYILDRRHDFGHFYLLYGARNPTEILFREDLVQWQSSPDISCRVTVDRGDGEWKGHTGVVTTLFAGLPPLAPERTRVVIVGPPVMFKFVVLEALARRIPQKNIYCSLERRMKCGIGKCGHCQANQMYACLDGPVFTYAQLKALREAVE